MNNLLSDEGLRTLPGTLAFLVLVTTFFSITGGVIQLQAGHDIADVIAPQSVLAKMGVGSVAALLVGAAMRGVNR